MLQIRMGRRSSDIGGCAHVAKPWNIETEEQKISKSWSISKAMERLWISGGYELCDSIASKEWDVYGDEP